MRIFRNIIRDMLIIAGLLVLVLSDVRSCMLHISRLRSDSQSWWGAHKSRQGDLVQMSYLDLVPKFHDTEDYHFTRPAYNGPRKVALYLFGDSYTRKLPDSALAGIVSYKYAWRSQTDIAYTPDSSHRNILLLEASERFFRNIMSYPDDIYRHVYKAQAGAPKTTGIAGNMRSFIVDIKDDIFNPNINQNLEYNLFNYRLLDPLREGKAAMTYRLFHRASGMVTIADNDNYLLYKTTVLPWHSNSSYQPLTDAQITGYVTLLNDLYTYYKKQGFDEVYFSIIPNPVTILQPKQYNGLIPRVEHHPGLKMRMLSVYDDYRNTQQQIYRRGDTHWNNNGHQIWLRKLNEILAAENYKASR